MRALVTGSHGFIGSAVARALRAAGHEVVGAVRRPDRSANEVLLDLADEASYRNLPSGIDAVVHSAAVVATGRISRRAMRVNAWGTRRLAAWARETGVPHFVHVSSSAAYGADCVGTNRREDNTPLCRLPLHAYLYSKAVAERHVAAAGVPYTTLRFPGVFGGSDGIVIRSIGGAILRGEVPFARARTSPVSTLWVENLCDALLAVLARGPTNAAYNVSDGEAPWERFVETFAKAMGREVPWKRRSLLTLITRGQDEDYGYLLMTGTFGAQFPSDRFRATFGWTPPKPWEDGARAAAAAYLAAHGPAAPKA